MIDQTIVIPNTTASAVYKVMLDTVEHTLLTGDVANIDAKVGGSFSAFGGYATGKILKLVPGEFIEETWRASDWAGGHFSTICFELKDTDGGVEIHFTQKNLPKGTEKEFESGWQDFYWGPLTEYFA